MSNPTVLEHEFVLPEFTPLDETVRQQMEEILSRDNELTTIQKETETSKLKRNSPELGIFTYEVQALANHTFRPYARDWHIDIANPDKRISFVSSTTPTSFAAGNIKIMSELQRWGKANNHKDAGDIYSALTLLFEFAGENWLESLLDRQVGELDNSGLDNFVSFSDVCVVQCMPYVVALGGITTTLHKGSDRHITEPTERIIAVSKRSEAA